MLALLKTARKTIVSGRSKILSYIFYAIGEILLVVIGILIAVSVNDWNERKKKAEAFHGIVTEIARDLSEDIDQFESQLERHYKKDSLLQLVIQGKLDEKQYREHWGELRGLVTSSVTFYTHKNGFNALQKVLEDMPAKFKIVSEELTNYYLYNADDAAYALEREDRLGWKNIEDFESKYEWHAGARIDKGVNDQMLNYLVNSKEYRNKAATYLVSTRNIISVCESGRDYGRDILAQLNEFDAESIGAEK
jgi:hypothetical protein